MDIIKLTKEDFEEKVLPMYFNSEEQADLYYYFENENEYVFKKYRDVAYGLNEELIEKIKIGAYLPNDFQMLRPKKLVMVDGVFVGFLSKLKKQYSRVDSLNLSLKEKTNLLIRLKELVFKLLDNGICFYDMRIENIIYNGKNILLCDVPDAYLFLNIGQKISDKELIYSVYRNLNILTISYLNNIPLEEVKEKLEDLLISWFNLKEYDKLIGVTDNQNCMNICYDILYNKNNYKRNDLLINHINKQKIKQKIF